MTSTENIEFLSRTGRKWRVRIALIGSDLVAVLGATLLDTYLLVGASPGSVNFPNVDVDVSYWQVSIVVSALWMLTMWNERLYDLERLTWGAGEFARVMRALALGVVVFILGTFALKTPGFSRAWTLLAFAFAVIFVSGGRLLLRAWLVHERSQGRMHRRTLIIGDNEEAERILLRLLNSPEEGLTPVGCLASARSDELPLDYCSGLVPALGVARDVARIVDQHEIDTVIIAGSAFDHEVVSRIINELRGVDVSIHVSSGLYEVLTSRVLMRDVAGLPLMTVRRVSLSPANLRTKRAFDVVVAGAMMVLGAPLWMLVTCAVKLDSPGPVYYRQRRVGQHGQEFNMLKFRSMIADADAHLGELEKANEATGPLFKMKDDPRITRIGRWMRKFSIDELPQLLNVLRGEMSLVGPRPPLPREVVRYTEHDWRRMEVPPGLTGLWQVSGRSSLTFEEMVRLDLYYIENWSVVFDVSLMLRTVPAVLFARGAC